MVIGIPEKWHFILASRSPRRRQLLIDLGLNFDIIIKDYDENWPDGLSGTRIAEYLAYSKAMIFKNEISENDIVITADTIVWCDDKVLDKPADYNEAFTILRTMSGKTHDVITAVTLLSSRGEHTFSEITRVTFDNLTDQEIDYYIRAFKPFDKAGAYGIQEWIGLAGITAIEGSFFNVMGLPVQKLYTELKKFIIQIDNI
jgi:septum formation protein